METYYSTRLAPTEDPDPTEDPAPTANLVKPPAVHPQRHEKRPLLAGVLRPLLVLLIVVCVVGLAAGLVWFVYHNWIYCLIVLYLLVCSGGGGRGRG